MKILLILVRLAAVVPLALPAETPENLRRDRLVAWCIVPFDAKQRGPRERAEMLKRLGLKRCAYDWRARHVSEFEEEIRQYQKHDIELFAFWDVHDEAFRLFEKYDLHPQIWKTPPSLNEGTPEERIKAVADVMEPLARRTARLGSKFGLYNHGGWSGEPENLVAICKELRQRGLDHVGIVYNWHHGHDHIDDWSECLVMMKPYLLCLNLNGMNTGAEPKILTLGKGQHDLKMLASLRESGYQGPVGIIDHRKERDTELVLRENLEGLSRLVTRLRAADETSDESR